MSESYVSPHRGNTHHHRKQKQVPGPWQAGQPPPSARGPSGVWKKPPWQGRRGRGRGQWCPVGPWGPRSLPGPAAFYVNEDRRWAPHNGPWSHPWHHGNDEQGPEDGFEKPGPWDASPFPGPADIHGNKDRRWTPHHGPPPPHHGPLPHPRNNGGDEPGPETSFEEELPNTDCFAKPELLEEEQHPLWPLGAVPWERGGFQHGYPAQGYRGLDGRRGRRFRRSRRELTLIHRILCPRPSRGNQPSSRSFSLFGKSQPRVVEEPQHRDPPQPLIPSKDDVQSSKQTPQVPVVVNLKAPEPPESTSPPEKSPAADPQAAAGPEQAAGVMLVELADTQKPAGGTSQSPSALETEPEPLEESSAGTGEHLKVELCSQSAPEAGEDGTSHPHGPAASPEPAERVHTVPGSVGEGQQHLSGAGEGKAEAVHDGMGLSGLQPCQNSQVPPGAATKADAQAGSDTCTAPESSPGTQHPPGCAQTEPAVGSQLQLCSTLPKTCPANKDLRSTTILAKKEEIELSYQRFSLTLAAVATMLLQKEPSMEAPLGLALRANLRQGRIYHLQELEDFINNYDSATLSL